MLSMESNRWGAMGAYLGSLVVVFIILVDNFEHFICLFWTFDSGPDFACGSHVSWLVTTGMVEAGMFAFTEQMAATLTWSAVQAWFVNKWLLDLHLSLI